MRFLLGLECHFHNFRTSFLRTRKVRRIKELASQFFPGQFGISRLLYSYYRFPSSESFIFQLLSRRYKALVTAFYSSLLILPNIILLAIINRNSSYFIYVIFTKVDNFDDFVDNSVIFYPFCSFYGNFINNITCIRIFYSD